MGTISIRNVILQLYGRSGALSMAWDLFGFYRPLVPRSRLSEPAVASVRDMLDGLRGKHINLNIIEWGVDQFTEDDDEQMDWAILRAREIFGREWIGVGRIQWFGVNTADARGLDRPRTHSEAEDMTSLVVVPNDGIDVAVPKFNAMSDSEDSAAGWSPVDGPCEDKRGKHNGCFVGMVAYDGTPTNLAHEVGHYLGLHHKMDDPLNVMFPGSYTGPSRMVNFNRRQRKTMVDHCMMRDGLPI